MTPSALRWPSFERPGQTDQIGPVFDDEARIDHTFGDWVEGAVIGGLVDPPEFCAADIGQAWAELESKQPEQAEDGVRIGRRVGHDFHRLKLGLLIEQKSEDYKAITQGTGDNHGTQTAELVGDHIVPGDPAGLTEIFRVRASVNGAGRRGEPHPIGRSNLTGSPMSHNGQATVGRDNGGVGGSDGLWTNEVLADPRQPFSSQGRHIGTNEWLHADVAGLADQSGAKADVEILDPGLSFAEVGEGFTEAGAGHDFKKYVRQRGFGHHPLDGGSKQLQALWLIELIERADDDLRLFPVGFETQIRIGVGPGGDFAKGLVQKIREPIDLGRGVERSAQGSADQQSGFLPGSALQHAPAGITIADTRLGEDISTFDRRAPGINDGEHIGFGIADHALRIEGIAPPCLGNGLGRRISHFGAGPVLDRFQIVDGGHDSLATWRRPGFNAIGDIEEQPSCPTPLGEKFGIGFRSVGFGDGLDIGPGGFDIGARQSIEKRRAPQIEREFVGDGDKTCHLAQEQGSVIQIAQASHAGFLAVALRIPDQVRQQGFGEFGSIVLGRCFQRIEKGGDSRAASRFAQRRDGRWLAYACYSGEPLKSCRWNAPRRCWAQIEGSNGVQPIQVAQEFGWRTLRRYGSKGVQSGECGSILGIEQLVDAVALAGAEARDQAVPKAGLCSVTNTSDQTLQSGASRYEHLVDNEPSHSADNQNARPVVPAPAKRIKPSHQTKSGEPIVTKIREPEAVADQVEVALLRAFSKITIQGHPITQVKLVAERHQNGFGDVVLSIGKCSQKTGTAEQNGKAQAIVPAAQRLNDLVIEPVEVEISVKLFRRRVAIKAREATALIIGEVTCRHGVRNLGVLRRGRHRPQHGGLGLAKHMCEIKLFCNMFRTPFGAAA